MDACPELAADLLAYQAIIVDANTKCYNDAWLAYDRKFRLALASLPHAYSWGIIDPNLWQSCHTSKGRLPCTLCSMVHPLTPMGCPFQGELPSCPHVAGSQSPSTRRFKERPFAATTTTASATPGPAPRTRLLHLPWPPRIPTASSNHFHQDSQIRMKLDILVVFDYIF